MPRTSLSSYERPEPFELLPPRFQEIAALDRQLF